MTTPLLFSPDGRPLKLAKRIGKGGEGEIYSLLDNVSVVVKYYTVSDPESRLNKIMAMINAGLSSQSPLVAFPISIVKNNQGRFAGFTMSKVEAHQPLHELYSPAARKATFPSADYRFLVRVAANVSRAIASVHEQGCVIGDINHSGILVSSKATVTLIDADSFQMVRGKEHFLCKVGVPEYTPPELQGHRLDGILRTENHDAFGLAVAIFQLLWMGRHPFSGRYSSGDIPMEKAVKEFRFAYTTKRAVGMSPPPAVPLLQDFPQDIRNAFEAAFGPDGETRRPNSKQWVSLISDLEKNLKVCASNSLHYYPSSASDCPWCRMERLQGIQLFLRAPDNIGRQITLGPISEKDIAELWRLIEAIHPPDAPTDPNLPILSLVPSPEVKKFAHKNRSRTVSRWSLIIFGIIFAILIPKFAIFSIAFVVFGLISILSSKAPNNEFQSRARDIETRWQKALQDWTIQCDDSEFQAHKTMLSKAKQTIEEIPARKRKLIQQYQENRQSEQLKAFLDQHRISHFRISGIGPAKLAMLRSYGIETAADVSSNAVQRVPGFGPNNSVPLINWRDNLAAKFAYNPKPNALDQNALDKINSDLQKEADTLRNKLANGAIELKRIANQIDQRRAAPAPILLRLYEQRSQIAEDMHALGLTMPKVVLPSPVSHSIASHSNQAQRSTGHNNSNNVLCPSCGSVMIIRQARRGRNAGSKFWGCIAFPNCTGTRKI